MDWNGQRIKSLRLQLGWDCSYLARRLGCDLSFIKDLEANRKAVGPELAQQLKNLLHLKANLSLRVAQQALSDAIISEKRLSQIDLTQLNKDN